MGVENETEHLSPKYGGFRVQNPPYLPNLAETARRFMNNRFGVETVGQIVSPTVWYPNRQKMQQCAHQVALDSKWQVNLPHLPFGAEIGRKYRNINKQSIWSRNSRLNYFTYRLVPKLAEKAAMCLKSRFRVETVGQIISPAVRHRIWQKLQDY